MPEIIQHHSETEKSSPLAELQEKLRALKEKQDYVVEKKSDVNVGSRFTVHFSDTMNGAKRTRQGINFGFVVKF